MAGIKYLFSATITFIVHWNISSLSPSLLLLWCVLVANLGFPLLILGSAVAEISNMLFCLAMVWFGNKLGRFLRELGSGDFPRVSFLLSEPREIHGLIWMKVYLFFAGWTFINVLNLYFFGYFKVAKFLGCFCNEITLTKHLTMHFYSLVSFPIIQMAF